MKQLVYFSAGWCQPCKTLAPTMEQVNKVIPVRKINVDYEPDVINRFNVTSVPTVILVENEQEVRRFVGTKSYNEIINFVNQ
jgi:thioredoxin-like negative regulator of GroEL